MGNLSFSKIFVDDLEAEADFYSEVFGLKRLDRIKADADGGVDEIVLGTGKPSGAILILVKHLDGRPVEKAGIVGFLSPDIEGVLERVKQRRGELVMGPLDTPDGGQAVLVTDLEGQQIEILKVGTAG